MVCEFCYNLTRWVGGLRGGKNRRVNIPYAKCTECGDYKEVSKKYINKTMRRWLLSAMTVESNAISSP